MAETSKKPKPTVATGASYASFWARLAAAIIDSILVALVVSVFTGSFNVSAEGISANALVTIPAIVGWIYFVFMTVNYGATLGKMALKIKVQHMDTGKRLSYVEAILREVVGKFVSSIVFGVGYFWMLWDDKKQTWHDKIGKSLVVKA